MPIKLIRESLVQGVPKVRSSNFMLYIFLIKTSFLHEISKICFSLYRVLVFRSSVTGITPLCFLSHSVAVAALSEISHVACRALDDSF